MHEWFGRRAAEVDARGSDARGEPGECFGGRWRLRKVMPRAEAEPQKGTRPEDAFPELARQPRNPSQIRCISREFLLKPRSVKLQKLLERLVSSKSKQSRSMIELIEWME